MPNPVPPQVGFNSNVRHKGRVFHIQTEDSGVSYGRIVTHVFADTGQILRTRRATYTEASGEENLGAMVRRMMKRQHGDMVAALRQGGLDEIIARSKLKSLPPVSVGRVSRSSSPSAGRKTSSSPPHSSGHAFGAHPAPPASDRSRGIAGGRVPTELEAASGRSRRASNRATRSVADAVASDCPEQETGTAQGRRLRSSSPAKREASQSFESETGTLRSFGSRSRRPVVSEVAPAPGGEAGMGRTGKRRSRPSPNGEGVAPLCQPAAMETATEIQEAILCAEREIRQSARVVSRLPDLSVQAQPCLSSMNPMVATGRTPNRKVVPRVPACETACTGGASLFGERLAGDPTLDGAIRSLLNEDPDDP